MKLEKSGRSQDGTESTTRSLYNMVRDDLRTLLRWATSAPKAGSAGKERGAVAAARPISPR